VANLSQVLSELRREDVTVDDRIELWEPPATGALGTA